MYNSTNKIGKKEIKTRKTHKKEEENNTNKRADTIYPAVQRDSLAGYVVSIGSGIGCGADLTE